MGPAQGEARVRLPVSALTGADFQRFNRGDWDSYAFGKRLLAKLPAPLVSDITGIYNGIREADSVRRANLLLGDLIRSLPIQTLTIGASEDEISYLAQKRADYFNGLQHFFPMVGIINAAYALSRRDGIDPDAVLSCVHSPLGLIARFTDARWWRRNLRTAHSRAFEKFMRDGGRVHRRAGLYVSDSTLDRFSQQQRRNRALLETMTAVNDLGDEVPLEIIVDASLANPRNRRAELMARIAGFESIARSLFHEAEFYTLTTPSRMHARHGRTGAANPRYDRTSPREAQIYLRKLWARIRARLKRERLHPYGFRIAEPHHDGTPHWHLLFFMPNEHVKRVRGILREYALADAGTEPGALKHRFKYVAVDRSRGTAAGYVAKYISKGIDGHGLPAEEAGKIPEIKASRVRAHASTWGMRQFQQIGGPPVGIYRELRRIETAPTALLESLRAAADAGRWDEFVRLMGGPAIRRKDLPVIIATAEREGLSRYGEPLAEKVVGLNHGGVIVPTRLRTWVFKSDSSSGAGARDPPLTAHPH